MVGGIQKVELLHISPPARTGDDSIGLLLQLLVERKGLLPLKSKKMRSRVVESATAQTLPAHEEICKECDCTTFG